MNLLGTSPEIAFDRRYPAEYRIFSYVARMACGMTEPFDADRDRGVTDFFFGPQPAWGPMPFESDALDLTRWRPALLRTMWQSASEAILAVRPQAKWYAEKLAFEETLMREAGVAMLRIDLVRDPRDVVASRRSFVVGGTERWERGAQQVADELSARLDAMDAAPADLRLRYEDLAGDLEATSRMLSERLGVELRPGSIERPAHHVTTSSVEASIGRWRGELNDSEAEALSVVAHRLGY